MEWNSSANKDNGSTALNVMPEGLYNVQVKTATFKRSKSDKDVLEVVYQVVDGPEGSPNPKQHANRLVFEYFSNVDFRLGDLYKLGKLCQLTDADLTRLNETAIAKIEKRAVKVRIVKEARNDRPGEFSNKVAPGQYFPYSGGATAPADLPPTQSQGPAMPPQAGQTSLPFNV